MKSYIPIALIWLRLLSGLTLLFLSFFQLAYFPVLAAILLSAGLVSDILDGIIARRLGISTKTLRRLDSIVDQVFFSAAAVAAYVQHPAFFSHHLAQILLLVGLEALTYAVSFIRFRKEVATHSIGAKLWTLLLFATLMQLLLQGDSGIVFRLCFWVGMATRLEIIMIMLTLRTWTNDVPSFYHALQLRSGKEIKRHKLFNG